MTKTNRLQVEQEHQRRAYEHYAAQSGRRSYRGTAEAFGVSPSTVKLWSRSFSWRERIRERDAETARRVVDQTLQTQVHERGRRRKIVHMALLKLAKGIADGGVRMQLGDLERLIRLQDYLDGRPRNPERMSDPEEIAAFIRESFDSLDHDAQAEVVRLLRPDGTERLPQTETDDPERLKAHGQPVAQQDQAEGEPLNGKG